MILDGSCHCGAVTFRLKSTTPYPFNRCYCSICRKTQGGGGFSINIMGEAKSLQVKGARNLGVYVAKIDGEHGDNKRHFCKKCASYLWAWSPQWPEWIYPFASAIDTPLPQPPDRVHLMLEFAAPWVDPDVQPNDQQYRGYPEEGIAEWHVERGLVIGDKPKSKKPKAGAKSPRRSKPRPAKSKSRRTA